MSKRRPFGRGISRRQLALEPAASAIQPAYRSSVWQRESEGCAFAYLAIDGEFSAVRFDRFLHDGKPEPGASFFVWVGFSIEKKPLHSRLRDAFSSIFNAYFDRAVEDFASNASLTADCVF
jgi:hypothetical protein